MSIALSTIVLFNILIPGLVFRRFYYTAEFSKQYFKESLFGIFTSTLIPSLFLHTFWIFLCQLLGYYVDFVVLGQLLESNAGTAPFKNIEDHISQILLYNSTLALFAAACGRFSKQLIRYYKLDRRFKMLRFQNHWHYVVKGELYDISSSNIRLTEDSVELIELIFVSALVSTSDGCYLYDGIFTDYELSKSGGLDSISLFECQVKKFNNNDSQLSEFRKINGQVMVLKYEQIVNLNFTYYTIDEDDDGHAIVRKVR